MGKLRTGLTIVVICFICFAISPLEGNGSFQYDTSPSIPVPPQWVNVVPGPVHPHLRANKVIYYEQPQFPIPLVNSPEPQAVLRLQGNGFYYRPLPVPSQTSQLFAPRYEAAYAVPVPYLRQYQHPQAISGLPAPPQHTVLPTETFGNSTETAGLKSTTNTTDEATTPLPGVQNETDASVSTSTTAL